MPGGLLDVKRHVIKLESIISAFCVCTLFLILAIVNLSTDRPYDVDFANIAVRMREMVNNSSIFIDNWSSAVSTLELDCSTLFAIPIYFLTRNIFVSFAFSNIVNIFIWSYVAYELLRRCGASFSYGMLAVSLILTQWGYGMLDYTNMMFYMGGQYVYKALVPLLLILVLTEKGDGKKCSHIIRILIYYGLLFVTSLSSGSYVFLCGLMPIFICAVIFLLIKCRPSGMKWVISNISLSVMVVAVGIAIARFNQIVPKIDSMKLRRMEAVFDGSFSTLRSLINLFRPLGSEYVEIGSIQSVLYLTRIVLVCFVFVFGLSNIPKIVGISVYRAKLNGDVTDPVKRFISSALITVFVWNFIVLFLTEARPRYHIIGVVALMIVSVISAYDFFSEDNKTVIPKFVMYVLCGLLVFVNVLSVKLSKAEYFHAADFLYEVMDPVVECKEQTGTDTVFIVGAYSTNVMLRIYSEGIFLASGLDGRVLGEMDYYSWALDKSTFSDRNLLVIGKDFSIADLPYYIQNSYSEIFSNEECSIYYSDHSPFDGTTGFPILNDSIDLPLPCNYSVSGVINEYGQLLTSDGGVILHSPEMTLDEGKACQMNIGFQTERQDDDLWMDVYKDGELCDSVLMNEYEDGIAEYIFDSSGVYTFDIRNENEGSAVNIGYITFHWCD